MDIPAATPYVIKKGATGFAAWAIQRALNEWGNLGLAEDGSYGYRTEAGVATFQDAKNLVVDGIAGPSTQAKIAQTLELMVSVKLPLGLLRGFCAGESGEFIAAVNWSVPGGVDCGFVQRRVYEIDYDNLAVKQRAFDSLYQLKLLGRSLIDWHERFTRGDSEYRWRLASLYHNYPNGAVLINDVGEGGLSAYWTTPQDWVKAIGAKFTDGVPVRTPLEWCKRYALGAPEHNDPGSVTRYVTSWP